MYIIVTLYHKTTVYLKLYNYSTLTYTMIHPSGRILRKRFLTKEEKQAYIKLQEKRKQEDKIKAMRKSNLERAKATKENRLKRVRAEELMKKNLAACEQDFRIIVMQWARDKTLARINKFFRLLEEFKCPMEPCYNTNRLNAVQKLLRKNKCGYKELHDGLNLANVRSMQNTYDNAHKLYVILSSM